MKNLYALFIGLGFLSGCSTEKNQPAAEPKLVVINVLEKELYDDAHIKHSIHVPFTQLADYANGLNKKSVIVLYCSDYMCSASGSGAEQLRKLGFDAKAYEGGMAEWYQLGYPTEGPAQKDYLKHAQTAPTEPQPATVITAGQLKDLMANYGLN